MTPRRAEQLAIALIVSALLLLLAGMLAGIGIWLDRALYRHVVASEQAAMQKL